MRKNFLEGNIYVLFSLRVSLLNDDYSYMFTGFSFIFMHVFIMSIYSYIIPL